MIAMGLAAKIFELSQGSDMSHVAPDDIRERFESLRGYGKLPRGRERRNQQLTNAEIAAALLGLVSPSPKWAGHTATVLCNLRTVGGASASLQGADTLQEVIERVLSDEPARKGLELTRFRGHLNVRFGGVHDGKEDGPVHAGV